MSQKEYDELKATFARTFGPGSGPGSVSASAEGPGKIHLLRSPGRVNLIGEHTDYNDGFVFPMAIEPQIFIACRTRGDDVVKVASSVYPNEFAEFSLQKKIERGKSGWGDYVRGVAAELIAAGIPLSGMDAYITNTLPVGGGLSSSAAIEVGMARAMLACAGLTVDPDRLAVICQRAEQQFAGVPCGIMDQMVVAANRPGHAMLLDCRTFSKHFISLDPRELRIVIVNSMVKHELSTGEYALRRKQCEEAVAILKRQFPETKSLRDVSMAQLDSARGKMSELLYRRARHVITENGRTLEMAAKLPKQFYDDAGELMVQSHASLRDDFEVSCPELDFLVDEAIKIKGVYGARMTGGGFGGCIVALAQPRSVEWLTENLHKLYTAKFGRQPSSLVTSATAGATVIE